MTVSYHSGPYRWSGQAAGREAPLIQRETLHTKGGPERDTSKCMEFQLTKVSRTLFFILLDSSPHKHKSQLDSNLGEKAC